MAFLAQILSQIPAELPTITIEELVGVAILAVMLLIGLAVLRAIFRLTKTLLKLGCVAIFFIVGAAFMGALLL